MPEPTTSGFAGEVLEHGGVAAEAIINAARELREVRPEVMAPDPATEVVLVRQQNGEVKALDLDRYLTRPRQVEGVHKPGDLSSFVALVHELGSEASGEHTPTTVWVHPTSGRVEAVLDDHADAGNQAGFGRHRAVLELQKTPAWVAWLDHNERLMTQGDFAEHVEARIPDIADPDGATLMEIVTTLSGKTEVNWGSGRRLQDGTVQLTYTEEATASAGRGTNLDIPQRFTLMIQPFLGLDDRVPITARLRYRLNGGDVRLGYTLDQPEDVLQDAITNVRTKLDAEFARVYVGSPR